MKRVNVYLSIGFVVVVFFMTMMTFPSLFTDKSPYDISGVQSYQTADGNYAFRTPPFEPSDRYIFGSDDSGRDVLSFVIYGAQLTLMIGLSVAVLRFILGLVFGIGASLDHTMSGLLVSQFNNVFNAIPPLIICIIVLSIGYLKSLSKSYSILVFIIVMTIVEWARVAVFVKERATVILQKDFIKSERIIGKSNGRIVVEHLLPHMFSELVVLFFMEISRVLTLMMQLGIFGIFIGNLKIVVDTGAGFIVGKNTSFEPEWASMLGSSKNYIRVAPWIVLSCSLAFFTSVLGFNFVGEGLRMVYQEGKKVFDNRKQQVLGLSIVLLIFMTAYFATYEPAVASAEYSHKLMTMPDISLVGMADNVALADDISKTLQTMGLDSVKGSYQYTYQVEDYYHVTSASVFVETDDLSYKVEGLGLMTYSSYKAKGGLLDLRDLSPMEMDVRDSQFLKKIEDKFILLDSRLIHEKGWLYFSEKLIKETDCLGILLPVDQPKEKYVGTTALAKPVMTARPSACDQMVGKTLSVDIQSELQGGQGINVVGQVNSPVATEETKGIILGFNYNYLDKEKGQAQLSMAMDLIARLKANEDQLRRNITIVFWDGGLDPELSGLNSYYWEYYYPVKHTMIYIDLQALYTNERSYGGIVYNDDYITMAKPDAYSLSKYLVANLEGATYHKELRAPYSVFFHKRGIQTLYLGVEDEWFAVNNRDQVLERLMDALLKEIY